MALCAALLAAGAVGGCAPVVVHAAGDGISFSDIGGEPSNDVLRVARAHCNRHGKRTRYDGFQGHRLTFQCIE